MAPSRRSVPASPLSADAVQAHLALMHGSASWHAFPPPVRGRVLSLWIELLQRHADARAPEAPTP